MPKINENSINTARNIANDYAYHAENQYHGNLQKQYILDICSALEEAKRLLGNKYWNEYPVHKKWNKSRKEWLSKYFSEDKE